MNCCRKKQKILECSICLETNQNLQIRKLKCNHKFHMNCIEEWLKIEKRCPLCNNYTVPFKEELKLFKVFEKYSCKKLVIEV